MRYAQECRTQIFLAIPATATGGLKIKAVAEESGVSTHRAAIGNDSAVANQIALASDVSAINANRQIMQQPVIHAGQETAICNLITVRVLVLVMYRHIIAATHGERAPAIVRRRRRRLLRTIAGARSPWGAAIMWRYITRTRTRTVIRLQMAVSWPAWITGCCIIWRLAFMADTSEARAIWLATAESLPMAARWVDTPLSSATAFIFRPPVAVAGIAMKICVRRSWA